MWRGVRRVWRSKEGVGRSKEVWRGVRRCGEE